MGYRIDIAGRRSGRLVALRLGVPQGSRRLRAWVCQCDCGNTSTVGQAVFLLGRIRSCGCLKRDSHFRGPQGPHRMTEEGRKQIAIAAKHPERRKKISQSLKGRQRSNEYRNKIRASLRARTTALTYTAAHKRVYQERGSPSRCEHCGRTDGTFHWANISDRFDDVTDYLRLCPRCHTAFDPERWEKRRATLRGEKEPENYSRRIV